MVEYTNLDIFKAQIQEESTLMLSDFKKELRSEMTTLLTATLAAHLPKQQKVPVEAHSGDTGQNTVTAVEPVTPSTAKIQHLLLNRLSHLHVNVVNLMRMQ